MAKILSDGRISVEAGDTLSGIYGADWKKLSGYTGDPTKLQIGTILPSKTPTPPASPPIVPPGSTPGAPNAMFDTNSYLSPEDQQIINIKKDLLGKSKNIIQNSDGTFSMGSEPDKETNRSDVLKFFQGEIDALEVEKARMRGELTTQYTKIGNERVDQASAIQARRGLLGSSFGEQATGELNTANANELGAVVAESDAKYNAMKASIMSQVRVEADKTLTDKKNAYTGDANDLLSFLGDRKSIKASGVNKAVAAMILQGVDLEKDDAYLSQMAKEMSNGGVGTVSKTEILNAYKEAKKVKDEEDVKKQQEALKYQPDMVREYEYAKKNGYTGTFSNYQNEDANRKKSIAGTGTGSGNGKVPAIDNYIAGQMGADGKISWKTYAGAAKKWIGLGGSIASFKAAYTPEILLDKGNQDALPAELKSGTSKWESEKAIMKELNSAEMINQSDEIKSAYVKSQGYNPEDFGL